MGQAPSAGLDLSMLSKVIIVTEDYVLKPVRRMLHGPVEDSTYYQICHGNVKLDIYDDNNIQSLWVEAFNRGVRVDVNSYTNNTELEQTTNHVCTQLSLYLPPKSWWDEQRKYVEGIRISEIASIKRYTDSGYGDMNEYLRSGNVNKTKLNEIEKDISNIRRAIRDAPKCPTDIVLYRGIGGPMATQVMKRLKNEFYFWDKGFSSASWSPHIGVKFSDDDCCILKIFVPKGTPMLYLAYVSEFANEHEILFHTDAILKYTGLHDRQRYHADGNLSYVEEKLTLDVIMYNKIILSEEEKEELSQDGKRKRSNQDDKEKKRILVVEK